MAKVMNVGKQKIDKGRDFEDRDRGAYSWAIFAPIMFVLGVVPLIMRLKIQTASGQDMSYALGSNFADLFSYWKSSAIFVCAILMAVFSFFLFDKGSFKRSKCVVIGVAALGSFVLLSLLSAIFSEYQSLVWWGQYGTRGGFVTILSYGIIFLFSLYFYRSREDVRFIVIPLGFMVAIESIIIFSQFVGKDILFTDFVRSFIIPKEYEEIGNTMKWTMEDKAYGSLYNPNYVGSFVALLMPIFVLLSIKVKDLRYRFMGALLVLGLAVCLFSSGSRAGIMGIGLSLVVGLVLFCTFLTKNPKALLISMLVLFVSLAGFNVLTGGKVVERIGSVFMDARSLFSSSESDFRSNLPISDIFLGDDVFTMEFADGEALNVSIDDSDGIVFSDKSGSVIDYVVDKQVYFTPKAQLPVKVSFQKGELSYDDYSKNIFVLEVDDKQWFMLTREDGNLVTLDKYANPIVVGSSYGIGFYGKERLGSNRGYIWSRSLPILRDNLIFGVGPDAFIGAFPNGDKLAVWALYQNPSTVIDKPHNLFLQIGINQGIIALVAFLVLNGAYVVNCFGVYFGKKEYSFHDMFGIGIMLGVVGYLGAGMFNDSVVSVAALYWCLLGIGFAVNYVNEKE